MYPGVEREGTRVCILKKNGPSRFLRCSQEPHLEDVSKLGVFQARVFIEVVNRSTGPYRTQHPIVVCGVAVRRLIVDIEVAGPTVSVGGKSGRLPVVLSVLSGPRIELIVRLVLHLIVVIVNLDISVSVINAGLACHTVGAVGC